MGNANGQKKFKEEEEEDPDEKQAMIIGTNGTTNETWSSPVKRNSQTKYAPLSDVEQADNEHTDSGPAVLAHTSQIQLSIYVAKFQLPTSAEDLARRAKDQGLTLKEVTTAGHKIEGTIIVNDSEPDVEVVVRWSENNWITYRETPAVPARDSTGDVGDMFTFVIESEEMAPSIKFALRCSTEGAAYWDNNLGQDYCFEVLKSSVWDT